MTAPPDRPCEVCGGALAPWPLSARDVLERCSRCAHVQRDLARCPAGARDAAYGGDPAMDRVRTALTYRRLARAGRRAPRSVYEVGYGTGALLRRFLDAGAAVGGTDPGALQVEVDALVRAQPGVVTAPLDEAPPAAAELVYAVHVVEHVPDVAAFVAAAVARTSPDGSLLLVTPAGDSASLERSGAAWWMLEDPTHVRFFSARSLALAAEAAGLVDVRVTRPLLDSLSVEAASLVRARRGSGPRGALTRRSTRLLAVASLLVVVPLRLARPRRRPSLQLVARRPAGP